MANLGNGGRTANGGSTGSSQKSSPVLKKAQLNATQARAIQRELQILFPLLSSVTLSELSSAYGTDFLKALNSVDSTKGLKKYIHDHCKEWLKQHTEGFTGHVPASWGRIPLTGSGKFTRISPDTKSSKTT